MNIQTLSKYREIELTPVKTYATKANAQKAVAKFFEKLDIQTIFCSIMYLTNAEGRFYPVMLNVSQKDFPEAIQLSLASGFTLIN